LDHHHVVVFGGFVHIEVAVIMNILADLHILILGLGDSGLAMVRWCEMQGAKVTVVDTRAHPPGLDTLRTEGMSATFVHGDFHASLLEDQTIKGVFKSPGLTPMQVQAVWNAAKQQGIWVGTELSLFSHALAHLAKERDYHPQVIAITGTNGKTTVTSLTTLLLKRAGLNVAMAGNIGPSLLDTLRNCLAELPQAWVLELSSFQLEGEDSFEPTAACVLNLTQDHLDWHTDMASYGQAKSHVYGQHAIAVMPRHENAVLALLPKNPIKKKSEQRQVISFGDDMPVQAGDYGLERINGMTWLVRAGTPETEGKRRVEEDMPLQRLMPADALRLRGQHNAVNALAALALASTCGARMAAMLHALREYRGEPHRMQSIGVINDIEYVDDSKGTNVGATVAAIQSLGIDKNLVVILGGDGKGQDFTPLLKPLQQYARAVILMGKDAAQIQKVLTGVEFLVLHATDMASAVAKASAQAQNADTVLLSPACSSLDMYKNYEERGSVFGECVNALVYEEGHA
jgi:UDP-N-acetylmuramoylalanine--D-glutamate ligase